MAVKLFLLGRPGSGKSTVARFIEKLANREQCPSTIIGDYEVLHGMFLREQNKPCCNDRQFRPSEYGGFDVQDFSVLDTALALVQHKAEVTIRKCDPSTPKIVLIEFARDDYVHALKQFDPAFLKDAHFLFLDVEINTCIKRIYRRALQPVTEDDRFVSEKIVTGYYQEGSTLETLIQLQKTFDLNEQNMKFIESTGSLDEFLHDYIRKYARSFLLPVSHTRRIIRPVTTSHPINTVRERNICPAPLNTSNVMEPDKQEETSRVAEPVPC
jgi:hypothetical protein